MTLQDDFVQQLVTRFTDSPTPVSTCAGRERERERGERVEVVEKSLPTLEGGRRRGEGGCDCQTTSACPKQREHP